MLSNTLITFDTDDVVIEDWLKEVFKGDAVPYFERNEKITEFLSKVMLKNKEAEKDAKEIIKSDQILAEIYNTKSEELSRVLKEDIAILNTETLEKVQSASEVATQLNLKEPTLTNFFLALIEAKNKELELQEKEKIESFLLSSTSKKISKVMKENEKVRRDIKALEAVSDARQPEENVLEQTQYLQLKTKEYSYKLKKTKKLLESIGFEPSISHRKLVERNEVYKNLLEQTQQLEAKLKSYETLPPNEALTRFKLQEVKNRLAALEKEFEELL